MPKHVLPRHRDVGIAIVVDALIHPDPEENSRLAAAKNTKQVPNAFTQLRFVLLPVYVVLLSLYLLTGNPIFLWLAIVAIGVAYVTDWLDGRWSRTWSHTSQYGEFYDPLADKAITYAAILSLACLGYFWFPGGVAWYLAGIAFWVVMFLLIFIRDWRVTWLRNRYLASGNKGSVAADKTGKYKTASVMVGTVLCLVAVALSLPPLTWIGSALMFAGCILSAYSWLAVYEKAYRII